MLIAKGLCSDPNDCTKRQFAFAAPESFGLTVDLYQVNDAGVLSDVVKQCALALLNQPEMKRLEISVYPISKSEHLEKPIFSRVQYKSFKFEN